MQERRLRLYRAPTPASLVYQTFRGMRLKLRVKSENVLVGEKRGDREDHLKAGEANFGDSLVVIMMV